MLRIRLSRIGKKNKPMYRLVISERAKDPYGRSLEILGSYNPYTKDLQAKVDRIKYWISKGAQTTPTVNNLLVENKVIDGKKVKASISRKKKKGDSEDKPAEDKPAEDKPAEDKPAEDKPAEDKPAEDKPAEDKPAEDKPAE